MKIEKKLIFALSRPLGITERPFRLLSKRIGMDEGRLLSTIKKYKKNGLVRRFGAILGHRKIGLKTNALVAWNINTKKVNQAVKILIKSPYISHCYLRSTYSFWPYNLYTMLHATDRKTCNQITKSISKKIRIKDYQVLFTLKEFKKTRINLSKILS